MQLAGGLLSRERQVSLAARDIFASGEPLVCPLPPLLVDYPDQL